MESMNQYYNERAEEYDDFYEGNGPASINDPIAYKNDIQQVRKVIQEFSVKGAIIDIPAGTGFWMPAYYKNVNKIIFVDQAENMLTQSKQKASSLKILKKCEFIQGDVLNMDTIPGSAETAIVGFLISHFTKEQELVFFNMLKKSMSPNRMVLLIDSVWSEDRAKLREKDGIQSRKLNDGTEFQIYKKYFTKTEAESIGENYGFKSTLKYFGKTMFISSLT